MGTDKEIKKRIAEEWLNFIPQLTFYSQNKFYRVVGCNIIGVELIKLPYSEDYRPHFVCYSLWKNDIKKCMDVPYIYFALNNKKGFQFDIPYLKHSSYINEAIECFKEQVPILFSENFQLKSLFEVIDRSFNDFLVKSNSAQQAKLFELKYYSALYTGSQSQVQGVLNQIHQASKNWNMQMFEMWFGKFDLWIHGLEEKVNQREDFFKQIKENMQDKKILQLKSSELTA